MEGIRKEWGRDGSRPELPRQLAEASDSSSDPHPPSRTTPGFLAPWDTDTRKEGGKLSIQRQFRVWGIFFNMCM